MVRFYIDACAVLVTYTCRRNIREKDNASRSECFLGSSAIDFLSTTQYSYAARPPVRKMLLISEYPARTTETTIVLIVVLLAIILRRIRGLSKRRHSNCACFQAVSFIFLLGSILPNDPSVGCYMAGYFNVWIFTVPSTRLTLIRPQIMPTPAVVTFQGAQILYGRDISLYAR